MLRPPSLSDMTSAAAAKSIKSLFSAADQRVIKLVIGAKPRYSLLDSAQIFVLFSAVAPTSMSALMASGLPVVGPRAVAVPHVVTDGVNGQLYEVCDAADAARAIRAALPLAGKMKKRCREIAEERFTYAAMVQRCVDVYGTVLGEETAPKEE